MRKRISDFRNAGNDYCVSCKEERDHCTGIRNFKQKLLTKKQYRYNKAEDSTAIR
jgi:hypothetical protein